MASIRRGLDGINDRVSESLRAFQGVDSVSGGSGRRHNLVSELAGMFAGLENEASSAFHCLSSKFQSSRSRKTHFNATVFLCRVGGGRERRMVERGK